LSSKLSSKNFLCKINFHTDNINNFTSRVWCALIEEIATRAEEMACEKEMAGEKEMACCVRGYHEDKDIWAAAIGEVLVCRR